MSSPEFTPLPLTDAEFHILLILSRGENHGYAVMKAINDLPEISFSLGPATLYRTIQRLLEKSFIEEVDDRPDPEFDDERRRYYRVTEIGLRVFAEETRRLSALVNLAENWGLA